MKLYATTTSERASKGQGGEYIVINIQDKNKKPFLKMLVHPNFEKDGQVIAWWYDRKNTYVVDTFYEESAINSLIENNTKGKQKKDECSEGCTISQSTSCCIRCGRYFNRA